MVLTEDILHFVWKNALFDSKELFTEGGEEISIINRGIHNHNSGPDFSEARIKIGNTIWAGQVELHVRSGDWLLHKHQNDQAYNNVILHVVYFHDKDVFINNQPLPVLVLKNRIKPSLFEKYKNLMQRSGEVACSVQLKELPRPLLISQIERSLADRLIRKSEKVLEVFKKTNNDWEETVFRILAMQMIGKINEQPMEWMLNELRLKMFSASGADVVKKEALFFGVAGMLTDSGDAYSEVLKKEYQHQRKKYNLAGLNNAVWKYGRMRPAHFPTIRMAQMAAILAKNAQLFSFFVSNDNINLLKELFTAQVSEYWKNHYRLGVETENRLARMGDMQQDLLFINVVAPVLFAYGRFLSEEKYKEKAMDILFRIKPEKNHIIRSWSNSGVMAESAFDSQGLIELYNNSCIRKKCLTCIIGTSLLKP